MAKEVDILSYWMPILRNLKEFKEIAKVEEVELRRILEAIDQTLANMFIETANEDGIKRFEKMLKIIPNNGDDISTRRFKVLSKWNNKEIYTDSTLFELLTSFCGEGNFKIIERYKEYVLEIVTYLSVKDAFETVNDLIRDVIPCNLVVELKNMIEEIAKPTLYVGGVVNTGMIYAGIPSSTLVAVVDVPLYSVVANSVGVRLIVPTEE